MRKIFVLEHPRHNKTIKDKKKAKQAGAHCINIPDGPRASARMSALLTAISLEQKIKIETILHYTCRDRNIIGIQSDLIGAQAMGLRNMLLVTGDPPKIGNYPKATGVFDMDAIGLTNLVSSLNQGYDVAGRDIGEPLSLSIGVGVNPSPRYFDHEMKRFYWKVKAGAEWAITQPVFDADTLLRFLEYIDKQGLKIPIVAGIWPLVSYKNAVFMNNEVPGISIPGKTITVMKDAKTPEDALKKGVELAQNIVSKIKDSVEGLQVSAPFGRIGMAVDVLNVMN